MTEEPAFRRLTHDWQSTWDSGVNPRTLQRYHNAGLIEMEWWQGKRYWRLRSEARSQAA